MSTAERDVPVAAAPEPTSGPATAPTTPVDDEPNAIHDRSTPGASWSSINLAEAVPGIMTPLCWGLWGPASEAGIRQPFYSMGALTRREREIPANDDNRYVKVFFGRQAVRVDFICRIGDLVPGQSGEGLARDVFGFVPPNYVPAPSFRRTPVIAARYPRTFTRIAARIRRLRTETDAWWRTEVRRSATLDLAGARRQFATARDRFALVLGSQATIVACCLQPVYEQLSAMATSVGIDGGTLMTGHGSHEETAAIEDLWRVSRGSLTAREFIDRHGFHGSAAGELSSVVWREEPEPVLRLVEGYKALGDDADPVRAEGERRRARETAEADFLARLPRSKKLVARLLLRLAATYLPLRGVAKVSYLQSIDVARAASRRIGALLAAQGVLADPEDVFFLTSAELLGDLPADVRGLVTERRAIRTRYQEIDAPSSFTGQPVAAARTADEEIGSERLEGIGASPGVVEGRAVVVDDPTDADIEPDDILVAHTTDPAWASAMFLSKGLVVDIGGMLSHAAVVAREIGVPCVMNTRTGTRALRTGDTIRVDGAAGTVEILVRAT